MAGALEAIGPELGEPGPSLRTRAALAPISLHGYLRLLSTLLREPDEGGALPRCEKALNLVVLAPAKGPRESAEHSARVAIRWGLKFAELRQAVGFFITEIGMGTF